MRIKKLNLDIETTNKNGDLWVQLTVTGHNSSYYVWSKSIEHSKVRHTKRWLRQVIDVLMDDMENKVLETRR